MKVWPIHSRWLLPFWDESDLHSWLMIQLRSVTMSDPFQIWLVMWLMINLKVRTVNSFWKLGHVHIFHSSPCSSIFQSRMMLTGSSTSPFAAIESAVYKTLFTGHSPYAALTGEVDKPCIDNGAAQTSTSKNKESAENGEARKRTPASPVMGQSESLKAKDESGSEDTTSCKKTD